MSIAIYDVDKHKFVPFSTYTCGLRNYISFERLIRTLALTHELRPGETIDQFEVTEDGGLNYRIKNV